MTQFDFEHRLGSADIKRDLENCYKEHTQALKQHQVQATPKSQMSSQKTIKKAPQKASQYYK